MVLAGLAVHIDAVDLGCGLGLYSERLCADVVQASPHEVLSKFGTRVGPSAFCRNADLNSRIEHRPCFVDILRMKISRFEPRCR